MNELLTSKRRWLLCALPDKAPRVERDGALVAASIKDRASFLTYTQACDAATRHGCGMGFVLCDGDNLACVDVDLKTATDEEKKKAVAFVSNLDTYAEVSTSGLGLHAWVMVKNSFKGVRKGFYEVYSRDRFIICTGKTFIGKPINGANQLFDRFLAAMTPSTATSSDKGSDAVSAASKRVFSAEQCVSDECIIDCIEKNGGKFYDMFFYGAWPSDEYPSQSEADIALTHYIGTYTKNAEQIKRIFRKSALGQREKAKREDYLDRTLDAVAIEKEKQAGVEIDGKAFAKALAKEITPEKLEDYELSYEDIPPGPLGALTEYCLASQHFPNVAIAIASALSFGAGVCGKSYTCAGSGLNLYALMVGKTGCGKGGISTAMENLCEEIVGASEFVCFDYVASAPALRKMMIEKKSVIHVYGEIAQKLQTRRDSELHLGYMRELLTLYDKSGRKSKIGGMRYSDKEKSMAGNQAVAYSLIGEGTPDSLLGAIDNVMKNDGTLSRFIVFMTKANRPARNEKAHLIKMDDGLKGILERVVSFCWTNILSNADAIPCVFDDDVRELAREFETLCTDKINSAAGNDDFTRSMWNRANIKVYRLAALCSVFKNPEAEKVEIDAESFVWARDLVVKTMKSFAREDEKGNVGDSDDVQEKAVYNAVKAYFSKKTVSVDKSSLKFDVLRENGIIPLRYITQVCRFKKCFASRYKSPSEVIQMRIKIMVDNGLCTPVTPERVTELGFRGKCYTFTN